MAMCNSKHKPFYLLFIKVKYIILTVKIYDLPNAANKKPTATHLSIFFRFLFFLCRFLSFRNVRREQYNFFYVKPLSSYFTRVPVYS